MAIQCPKCPLRFDLKPMLADHMRTDHGVSPESTGYLEPPAARVGLVRPGAAPDGAPADAPADAPHGAPADDERP